MSISEIDMPRLRQVLKDPTEIYKHFHLHTSWVLTKDFLIHDPASDTYDHPFGDWLRIQYTIILMPNTVHYTYNMGDYAGLVRRMHINGYDIHLDWPSEVIKSKLDESHLKVKEWLQSIQARMLWQTDSLIKFNLREYAKETT